jgi:response regulator RpfG family c-di-GMP phosphodiesterase
VDEKINILMVDDQPGKLLTYEAMLGELGENLIKAHSGMEALEHLLKVDVAVVLMDVSMPGMDGFETAQMIHDHPRFQNTPIVFISGIHMTDLDRLKGYQHGAVDYLSVPVVPELLRAKVRVFAELHRKTQQLEALNAQMTRLQDEERRRIARELHDSVGQLLAAITMNSAVVEEESRKLSPDTAKRVSEKRCPGRGGEQADSYHFSPAASTLARRSGACICASLVCRRILRTQQNRCQARHPREF